MGELIFFLEVGMVLHFGFRMRIMSHRCFCCYRTVLHRSKDVSVSLAALPREELGVHMKLREREPGQVTQTEQREIPCLIMSLNSKTGVVGHEVAADWGLTGHQLAVSR